METCIASALGIEKPVAPHDIAIAPMGMEDIEVVAEIEAKCYATPWHSGAYITEITNRHATYLVAKCGDRVVGYCGMWVVLDEAQVTTVAVDPEFQGRKISRMLFHHLMEAAVERGAARASLEVRERNYPALAVYRRYGFQDAAVRRNYYRDTKENGLVMWRERMRESEFTELLARERAILYGEA